jgi:hypothetical protein
MNIPPCLETIVRIYETTRPVQKVSDLWPGKIHLHTWRSATLTAFEVVSLWLNTLLPAVQPLFEAFLECLFANGVQLSRRVPYSVVSWVKSESLSAAFSGGGTAKNHKEPCRESREPVEPQKCCVWPKTFESVARNELVRRHEFRGHSPHCQIIGQNGMYRTSAYPHFLRKFSDGDTTVLHDQKPALGRWARHFGLLRASRNERRPPPTCGHLWICCTTLLNLCDAHGMYVHEGALHLATTARLPCFISFRGKKLRRILFEQASYTASL